MCAGWEDRVRLDHYRDVLEWDPFPPVPRDLADRRPSVPRGVSTLAYAPEQQFEAFRSALGPLMDVGLPPGVTPADGFVAEFMVCGLGGLSAAFGHADAFSFSHALGRPGSGPRRAPVGCWRLMLPTVGEMWIESPDGQAHIRPGDLFLLSMDEPFRGRATHHGGLWLTLPRDLFAAAAANFDSASGAILAGPLTALLVDYLRSLEARLIGMSPEDLVLAGRATAEMLAACVGPSRDRQEQARHAIVSILFDRARAHIQAHFGDPELTPERVAQDLRVSRSNLYRVFEQAGGVSRYIQQCRLFAAHAALTGESGRRIQDIAYSCGFKLASDFTRAFRREFGYSPREARDVWRKPAEPAIAPASAPAE
ncbi:AraC family transcriptional regulator [Inquilinus sp. NPDC058860]|uniref:AraC family transcriptional regulator n=1 Tax=Inquilinus sp. NPDC058860 TaxID=3346652 RepID=UPI0036A633FD